MARVFELAGVLVSGGIEVVVLVVPDFLLELQPLGLDLFDLFGIHLTLDFEFALLLLHALLQLTVLALALLVLFSEFLVLVFTISQLFFEVVQLTGEFEHFSVFLEGLLVLDLQQALRLLVLGLDFFELIANQVVVFVFREAVSFFEQFL